jgi:AraC-like DNA-binding protein
VAGHAFHVIGHRGAVTYAESLVEEHREQARVVLGHAARDLARDPRRHRDVDIRDAPTARGRGELADEASLSRAAFARRFSAKLGVAPLSYLTDWRMALARERLRDTDDGLVAIAASIGYASEFSFAAAFKRHHGTAPGRWRLATRAINV